MTKDQPVAPPEQLPKWSDCEFACDEKTATPLQRFIYEYEPADDTSLWRERLAALIEQCATTATVDDEAKAREIIVAAWGGIEQTIKQNQNDKGEMVTQFSLQPFVPLIAAALAQSRADAKAKVEAKRDEWAKRDYLEWFNAKVQAADEILAAINDKAFEQNEKRGNDE